MSTYEERNEEYRKRGCVCSSPWIDHGLTNNCPICGCWAGFGIVNGNFAMRCGCNKDKWRKTIDQND